MTNLKDLKVLIADDSRTWTEKLRRRLEFDGFGNIYDIFNDMESVDYFEIYTPQLVFIDHDLPERGGLYVYDQIRALEHGDEAVILGMHNKYNYLERFWMKKGANGFFVKSLIERTEFSDKVTSLLIK